MDLLLDDGKLRLRVTAKHSDAIDTEVLAGGELSDRKGVNVPQAVLDLSPLTEKDRRDLAFGLELGVNWSGPVVRTAPRRHHRSTPADR